MKLTKQILREITADKSRAIKSMLAIIAGMSAFGIIFFCYIIIVREIPKVYSGSSPESASILVDRVDDELLELIDDFDKIAAYEVSGYYNYRIQVNDDWKTLELFASQDYTLREYNKPGLIEGRMSLDSGEALIEGDAVSVAKSGIGNTVSVMLDDAEIKTLELVGSINDLSVHPASIHNVVYLYMNFETMEEWGLSPNKIEYVVSGETYDREHIIQVSNEFIQLLEHNGYTVRRLQVEDTPGESMMIDEYEGALLILQIFSIASLIFGCMIMSNLIAGILSKQIRQIGVMKAIGGTYKTIFRSYLAAVLLIICTAAGISASIVLFLSGRLSIFLMGIGNLIPESTAVPWYMVLIFLACILSLPLIVTAGMIRKGLRLSIKDALGEQISSVGTVRGGNILVRFLSRPVLLSVRNAFRKKGRFILNIMTLTFAGILFVVILNSILSVQRAIDDNVGMLNYDYQLTVGGQTGEEQIADVINGIDEIEKFEVWSTITGQHIDGKEQAGNSYSLIAPGWDTGMFTPLMTSGRWLEAQDRTQVVVTEKFLNGESDYQLGDEICFQINGEKFTFEIIGVTGDFNTAEIYINGDVFEEITGNHNIFRSIKLETSGGRNKRSLYAGIDETFEEHDIYVYLSENIKEIKSSLQGHYAVTLQTFFIVIILLIVIAGFGLSATMHAQTSERKKETGIMKAVGASRRQIIRVITAESIFISLVSCIGVFLAGSIAAICSLPAFGVMIDVPLAVNGIFILILTGVWVVAAALTGWLASRKVAKRAAEATIQDVLTGE